MEIRIDEVRGSKEVASLRNQGLCRRCLFYKEKVCSAPRLRFVICRTCYRVDPRLAMRTLLEKIKQLAVQLFNLPETEPGQLHPEK